MPHRIRGLVTLVAVSTVSALVGACTPSTLAPWPSPSPTPSASSAAPTETEFQKQEREAYEGAERAYREFRAEYNREITSTYHPRVTVTMRTTAGGPFLSESAAFLKNRRTSEVKSKGNARIVSVKRVAFAPDRIELKICEDASSVTVLDRKHKQVGRGIIANFDLTARARQGHWKVWSVKNQKEVTKCDG